MKKTLLSIYIKVNNRDIMCLQVVPCMAVQSRCSSFEELLCHSQLSCCVIVGGARVWTSYLQLVDSLHLFDRHPKSDCKSSKRFCVPVADRFKIYHNASPQSWRRCVASTDCSVVRLYQHGLCFCKIQLVYKVTP